MSSAKSRVASRIVLDGLARGSFFILTLYLARRLGTGSFGTLAYAMSLAQIFYVFTDLGLLLQMMADAGPGKWISYYRVKISLLAMTFVGASLAGLLLWRISAPYWIFTAGLLWMSGNSVFDFQQAVCNTAGNMAVARRILFFQRGVFLLVIVPVLWFRPTLEVAAFSLAAMSIVASLISHFLLMKDLNGNFSSTHLAWQKILRDSLPNAIGSAFYFWGFRSSIVLLAWESTKEAVGAYAAAGRVFEMSYVLPAAVMAIGLPHLSGSLADGAPSFWRRWKRYLLLLATVGGLWAIGFGLLGGLIVRILFGAAYEGAIPSMRLLGVTGGFVIINHLFNHTMVAIGRQKRLAATFVCGFALCLLLCIILIPTMQAQGAALAVLVTEISLSVFVGLYLLVNRHTIVPVLNS